MKVARILRRTVVVGLISALLGIGMAVTATPAQAMPREDCDFASIQTIIYFDLYEDNISTNRSLALWYLAISDSWADYQDRHGCPGTIYVYVD
jgi:hypothetical protein